MTIPVGLVGAGPPDKIITFNPAVGGLTTWNLKDGSFTFPAGSYSVTFLTSFAFTAELWGPGCCGVAAANFGSSPQYTNGSLPSTNTTFSTLTAGRGNTGSSTSGGAGGTASGGDINTAGNAGGGGSATIIGGTTNHAQGGNGGTAPNGGIGGNGGNLTGNGSGHADGQAGTIPGSGGGGGCNTSAGGGPSNSTYGGGGGSGAYLKKTFSAGIITANSAYTIVIGVGSSAPSSADGFTHGGKGSDGQIKFS